jgi:uncharacterized protein (TIGR03435 family)
MNTLEGTALSFFLLAANICPGKPGAIAGTEQRPADQAPAIAATDIMSSTLTRNLTWDSFSDRVVLHESLANWCGPFKSVVPHLAEIASGLDEGNRQLVSIQHKSPDAIVAHARSYGVPGLAADGPMDETFLRYDVDAILLAAPVDNDRRIVAASHPTDISVELARSVADDNSAADVAQDLSRNKAPAPTLQVSVWKDVGAPGFVLGGEWDPASGRYQAVSHSTADLRQIIGFAHEIAPSRVVGAEKLSSRWSVTVTVASRSSAQASRILRKALEESIGCRFERLNEEVVTYQLRESVLFRRAASGGHSGGSPTSRTYLKHNSLEAKHASGKEISQLLEQLLLVPVTDQTNPDSRYSAIVQFDAESFARDPESVLADVRVRLKELYGLELVPVTRTMEVLRVHSR